ncbi:uncharacterized protein E0L32_000193 [Thyridium curvatum]|uniref:Uncharacterized protein n=1 Tax=Thyridium curvatum TaxID=1093900 RepID=A0A507BF03_9PEZI|nr:uncharacterized protein E0L32_000193 [Thyridium curvatum]TPX15859.1 hypothetical protein E0L32_000193 [Thyridium curvatum]
MKLLQWSLPLAMLGTLGDALPAADCDKIPSWTFKNLKWHTLDTVGQNGSASFTLVNSVTDKAVDLKCTLVANYRCQIKTDDATEVTLQAQNGVLYVWVDQDLTCGDATVKHVGGSADLDMNCDIVQHEDINCTAEESQIKGDVV